MKVSVILFSLGGPDRAEAVRPFLFNLFNDKAIISLPWPFRPLLAWWIARKRAPVAKEIYAKIGGGSPILANTQAQMQSLQRQLGKDFYLRIAMRYWQPFTKDAIDLVLRDRPDKIVLLPLYPQYSTTTSGSSFKEWHRQAKKAGISAQMVSICCYPLLPGFLQALARAARLRIDAAKNAGHDKMPFVIFSAHGLPQYVIAKGDPYQHQMEKSANALAEILKLPKDRWVLAYQSKVGRLKWLEPATDKIIEERGIAGESIVVVPLAFVSEHSETLAELDIEYKELAMRAGARGYWRVPAVGTDSDFMANLAELIKTAAGHDEKVYSPSGTQVCGTCRACPAKAA